MSVKLKTIYLLSKSDDKIISKEQIPENESPRIIKWNDRFFVRTGCITDYREEFIYDHG